jgi:hypothetical protein
MSVGMRETSDIDQLAGLDANMRLEH